MIRSTARIRASGGLVIAAMDISRPVDRLRDNRLQIRIAAVEQVRAAAQAVQAVHRDLGVAQ